MQRLNNKKLDHLEDYTAERGLIGCILLDPQILDKLLAREDRPLNLFTDPICKNHMLVILDLYDKDRLIDKVTINRKFIENNIHQNIQFVDECENITPSPLNWSYYLEILQENKIKRETKILCDEVSSRIAQDPSAEPTGVLEELFERAEGLCKVRDSETSVRAYKDIRQDTVEFFTDCFNRKGGIKGITTGLYNLDQMISGLNKGELNIIAARPSVGKTSLGLCISDAAAARGHNVLFFSLEMTAAQLQMRSICSEMNLDYRDALKGDLSQDDMKKIQAGIDLIGKRPIFVDDSGTCTIHNIKSKSKRLKRDVGIDLIVIDYLQIISSSKKFETRALEVGYWSSQLKALAKDLNVPVVCLSQLSRAGTINERKPRLTDLRDSGAIEQDADVVVMLHRDNDVDMSDGKPYPLSLIVAKQRNGPVGEINIEFVPKYTKMRDASPIVDIPVDSYGNTP